MSWRQVRVMFHGTERPLLVRADHESLDWLLREWRTGKSRVIAAPPAAYIARAHVLAMLDETYEDPA